MDKDTIIVNIEEAALAVQRDIYYQCDHLIVPFNAIAGALKYHYDSPIVSNGCSARWIARLTPDERDSRGA